MRPKRKCPHHQSRIGAVKKISRRLLIDLEFTKNGYRKRIVKYEGIQGYCPLCYRHFPPPALKRLKHRISDTHFRHGEYTSE